MSTIELNFDEQGGVSELFGQHNRNLVAMEQAAGVVINSRGNNLSIEGQSYDVELAASMITQLHEIILLGHPIYPPDVIYALTILKQAPKTSLKDIFLDQVYITGNKRVIAPKSINQKSYIDAIRHTDIVFGIGPAGTGKTYLAVAMAIAALTKDLVGSIILTRPAVEAGESLGFLPGDIAQKIDPYLRPLHDALNDMLGRDKSADLIEQGIIEIAPLAFMRGRTLNNAFIILDEAQNTTKEQMQMFLTRLGFSSKAVITGDITQIDLTGSRRSGLIHAAEILKKTNGISFNYFSASDVVRHPLVQKIIKAYESEAKKTTPHKKHQRKP